MNMTRSRVIIALTSLALLLGACSGEEAPDVGAIASSPTAEATEEADSPSPEPEPEETDTAEPSPDPSPSLSPSPCPQGQQRVAPGAACFEPSPAPSPSPEPEPEPEPIQEETSEPEPEPEPAGPCEDRDARGYSLTAVNFEFGKSSIADVCSGDTVTLTVEEGSHSFTVNGAEGDTGVFGSGESRTTTVSGSPGTYTYKCTLHPNQMSGQIEIIG